MGTAFRRWSLSLTALLLLLGSGVAAAQVVSYVSPNLAVAGGPSFDLFVGGSGFASDAIVRVNGSPRVTTFSSGTSLYAEILATDIASAGTFTVTVFNPTSGTTSNGAIFTVFVPNPVPTLSSLSPSSTDAGGADFPLTVTGSNFVAGSVVRWGGANRTTTFNSSTSLTATIPASLIATAGSGTITVFNGSPGGGTSNSLTFTINAVAPDAPTIGTATAGNGQASVTFTAPASNGGSAITTYTATASPGGAFGTCAGPAACTPTVTGLSNGTAYTFTVTATNAVGTSVASAASNSVTPKASQLLTFFNPGTQNFGTTPTLTATSTAGAGYPVSFSSSTPGICNITTGGALSFVSAGSCTIDADQAGDAAVAAAAQVSQTFTVAAVVPGAPIIGTATAGDQQALVSFTAPASNGGAAITNYTVTTLPADVAPLSGSSSPMVVTGLTNGQSYTFTVTATNGVGTGSASAASNSVTPTGAPAVVSVGVPANGTYLSGQALDFTVNWDQAVLVTGTPSISLTIGASTQYAQYVSGSGSSATLFRYTVAAGDLDLDGIGVGALGLNGGTVTSGGGTSAVLTLSAVGSTSNVLVGAPVPTITSASYDMLTGVLTVFGADFPALPGGADDIVANRFTITGVGGVTRTLTDTANVDISSTAAFTLVLGANDRLAASLVLDNNGPTASDGTLFNLAAAEDWAAGADPAAVVADLSGNGITVSGVDISAPQVSAIDRVDASPTNADSVVFAVTFSKGVSGVDVSDFTLSGTGTATGSIASLTPVDASHYTVVVDGVAGDGTLRLDLNGAGTSIVDGNGRTAPGFNGGQAYVLDNTAPAITGVTVPADGRYLSGSVLAFTVTFNEAVVVTGSPAVPLTLDVGGAQQAQYVSGSGTNTLSFSYPVTATDNDQDGIAAGPDLVLNGGTVGDAVSNAAGLTLTGLGATTGVLVGLQAQVITDFASSAPPVFGYAPGGWFVVSATGGGSTSPLVFAVAAASASVCSISGTTVTMLSAGTCSLTADQAGDANYSDAPQVLLDVVINPGSQSITFGGQAAQVFAPGATFALNPLATASSGLPVTYSSLSAGVCSIGGTTVTMLSAGSCDIAVDQAGDSNYNAAPQATQSIAIGQAAQAITGFAASPSNPVYTPGGTFTVSATGGASTSALVFGVDAGSASVCSISGGTVTMLSAGTCSLTADQAGDANYTAAPQATLDVVIGAASQTIGFGAQAAQTFVPNATFALSPIATATSGLPVAYSSQTAGVCSISGTTVTILSAGSCVIAADQSGDGNYLPALQVTQPIAIGQATQVISGFAASPANPAFAPGGTFTVSATGGASSSPVLFAVSASSAAVCSISGSTVTTLSAGTCSLTADQAGDTNYSAAPQATLDVVIGAGSQTIGFGAQAGQSFVPNGTFALSPVATASSGLAVAYSSQSAGVCAISGTTVTMLAAGSCVIAADQAGDADYAAAPQVTQSIAIGQGSQSITFGAQAAQVFVPNGTFALSPVATASSGLPVAYSSQSAGVCSISGTTVTMLSAGSCVIAADQGGDADYTAAPQVTQSIAIGQAVQAITGFAANPPNPVYTPGGTFTVSATGGASTSPVLFGVSASSAPVCSISGGTVTMLAAGTCSLTADQAGDTNYSAAPQLTLDVVISAASQTIVFGAQSPQTYVPNGTFAVNPVATASSGLPVAYSSQSSGVCSISGTTVTMLSAGSCVIAADQAGDGNYTAAPQVTQSIAIGQGSQSITFGAQAAQVFVPNGTFALNPLATASTGLPVAYSSQSAAVCSISGTTVTMLSAGSCVIAADQAGDGNYTAAPQVTQAIAIGQAAQAITGFAANPAAPAFAPGATFALSATGGASTSPVVFGVAASSAAVCSVSGSTVTMLAAGTCSLTADQAGDANYSAAPQLTLDVVIGAGSQTISFGAQAGQTFVPNGSFALNPVATASSGLPVSYATQSASVCSISGTTVTMLSAGNCVIAADQAGDADYSAAAQVTQSIAIGQATQAITGFVANPAAPAYSPGATFAVSATGGGSTSPVVFAVAASSAAVCSISGSTVTMLSAGTCSLTANQAGDTSYSAAPQASLDVVIDMATPLLTWLGNLVKVQGEPAFDLPDPSSNSPGAFSFASSNASVATVSGRRVTIAGAGTTTLTATLAPAGSYAGGSISVTLTVAIRPDPTQDPGVAGGLQAQADASVRFATAQQGNIHDRLSLLRSGSNASGNNVSLNAIGGRGPGLSLNAGEVVGDGPSLPQGWGLWTAGTVSLGERDGETGSHGFDFRSDGLTIGIDRLFGEHTILGLAGGYGWNDSDFDNDGGELDARSKSLALYGLWHGDGALFADGLLGTGDLDFDIERWSSVADGLATAEREGSQTFASLTFGYEHHGGNNVVTTYGRFDTSRTTLDAYRETGLGIYNLDYREQDVDNSTIALGVENSYSFRTASALLHPFWSLEYREALENRSDAGLNYVVMPRANDYVLGLRSFNDDLFALGAGLDVELGSGWRLSFLYRREQSDHTSADNFGLHVSWGQTQVTGPQALTLLPGE